MLPILFFLSLYRLRLNGSSDSYFYKYSFLEYGFNANSEYIINLTQISTSMVFGLATKQEIKLIDNLKHFQAYCNGIRQLSAIQYTITSKDKLILGTIPNKTILIPYAFTCSSNYEFTSEFNFTNGKNHLDYRCQHAIFYTFIIFLFIIVYTIIFMLANLCSKQKKTLLLSFMYFLIFITFSIQNIISVLFFNKQKNSEYFNNRISSDSEYKAIIRKDLILFCFYSEFPCFLFISLFVCFTLKFVYKFKNQCFDFTYTFIQVSAVSLIFILPLFEIKKIYIIILSLYGGYCLLTLIVPPICSLSKFGIFLFLIGNLVTYPGAICILNLKEFVWPTHVVTVYLNMISIVSQFLALLFLTIGFVQLKKRETNDSHMRSDTFYRHQNGYTNIDTSVETNFSLNESNETIGTNESSISLPSYTNATVF